MPEKNIPNKQVDWERERSLKMLLDIAKVAQDNIISYKDDTEVYNASVATIALRAIEQANKMCGFNEPHKMELANGQVFKVVIEGVNDE